MARAEDMESFTIYTTPHPTDSQLKQLVFRECWEARGNDIISQIHNVQEFSALSFMSVQQTKAVLFRW